MFVTTYLSMYLETAPVLFSISLVSVACIAVLLLQGIYNRYFHPLSRFPGPLWASLTDFYKFIFINSVPTFGLDLHAQYGPIVRLAPNTLSISDPELLPIVYHRNADKPPLYGTWLFGDVAAMFQTLKHEEHAVKKRLISPCCSMKALKAHESQIDLCIIEFDQAIRKRSILPSKKIDFAEHTRWFLSDVFSLLNYGESLGCLRKGTDVNGLIAALQSTYFMVACVAMLPWLLLPVIKHPIIARTLYPWTSACKGIQKLASHYDSIRARRCRDPSLKQQKCIFDSLSQPQLHPPSSTTASPALRPEELRAEVITFTAATLDGVAAFISPFIDVILSNPSIHKALCAEIDAADAAGSLSHPIATFDETNALPYFTACIAENLRVNAPAQTLLPRYVSSGGMSLYEGSTFVPPGAEVAASPYIIHRSTAIFGEDAHVFRPERWMGDPERKARMEKYGMWWGYGDRECAGKNFALLEVQKLCLHLFRTFDIETPEGEGAKRFTHKRWAVGMFWDQWLLFKERGERVARR